MLSVFWSSVDKVLGILCWILPAAVFTHCPSSAPALRRFRVPFSLALLISLPRAATSCHALPRAMNTSLQMYGKENRLSLSSVGLPSASSLLGSSSVSALAKGTTNKRQQMLKYSASRRLSLKLPPKGAKVKRGRLLPIFFSFVYHALCCGALASNVLPS